MCSGFNEFQLRIASVYEMHCGNLPLDRVLGTVVENDQSIAPYGNLLTRGIPIALDAIKTLRIPGCVRGMFKNQPHYRLT